MSIQKYLFCQRCGPVEFPHKRCPDAAINRTQMVKASDCDALIAALKGLMPKGKAWRDGTMDHMPGIKGAREALERFA